MDNRKKLLELAEASENEDVESKDKFDLSISHDGRNYLCRFPKDFVQELELIPELDDDELKKIKKNEHIPKDWFIQLKITDIVKREGTFKILKRNG